MKMERFEYQNKDIPMLKKEIFVRFLFMFLFVGVFAWQLVLMVKNYADGSLSPIKAILSVMLLISSLMFAIISFSYAFKNLTTMQKIRQHGSYVRAISIISNAKKDSFLKLYFVVTQLISLFMLVVLCCALTYNILEYVYFTTISYYLPILLFVSIAGFNSVYHIKQEIKTIQNVNEFNSMF